ncbi:MAG: hypothetical protein Q8M07_18640 [Prosthecobacter sp.]|nr:hypothetical protein [Prosthecobacter sp.]
MHEQIVREAEINRLRQVGIDRRRIISLQAGNEQENGTDTNKGLHWGTNATTEHPWSITGNQPCGAITPLFRKVAEDDL